MSPLQATVSTFSFMGLALAGFVSWCLWRREEKHAIGYFLMAVGFSANLVAVALSIWGEVVSVYVGLFILTFTLWLNRSSFKRRRDRSWE